MPCVYCSATPTQPIEIVPAEVKDGKTVHRAHRADLCLDCLRRLGIMVPDRSQTKLIVDNRKERTSDARREARAEMAANQMSLLPDEHTPGSALTEG